MVEVVVEFDYDAEEEDELTIRKGDIISNVDKQDGGWWSGELNGKKGVFPDNFVKDVPKEEQKVSREIKKEGPGQTEIADKLQNILSKGGGPSFAPPGIQKRINDPSKRQIRAKAAFSYAPENEDELKLEVGDVIEVIRQEEEGWWEGTTNGKTGVFPSNFVEVMLEDGSVAKAEDVVIPEGTGEPGKVEVQSKKVRGVGLGNIFANGPIVLKKAGSKDEPTKMVRSRQSVVVESPTAPKLLQKNPTPVPPVAGPKKPLTPAVPRELPNLPPKDMRDASGGQRARVLFSYKAENEDELTLEEGNILVVLEKELEDSGWWKGELNGKVGVFPDNFVQLLPKDEPTRPKKPPPPTAMVAPNGKATPPPLKSDKPGSPAFLRKAKDSTGPIKKGPPPPPIGKKPQKPADSKLLSQTDDQKVNNSSHKSTEDLSEFDSVESAHEKLKHPTANRVKAPQRRPPSSNRDKEDDEMPDGADSTEMADDQDVEDVKEEVPVTRPAPPLLVPKKTATLPKQPHSEAVNGAQASNYLDLAELKKEIDNLKANSISKERYNALEAECKELKESIAQIKSSTNKKIYQLMTEIDEEKKTRLNMQVEIDRLKTLVTS